MGGLDTLVRGARQLAQRQHGLVTGAQLAACGISNRVGLCRLVRRGRLIRLHPGVYRLGDVPETAYQRLTAACLWREDVVLSHRSAAAWHQLDVDASEEDRVEVWAHEWVRGPLGVRVRGGRPPTPREVVRRGVVRVTSPLRTVLDLASELSEEQLGRAFENAWDKGLLTLDAAGRYLAGIRRSGRLPPGGAALERWLRGAVRRQRAMQSALEVRFWLQAREAGLPLPEVQFPFHDGQGHPLHVDFGFPRFRLAVETRGWNHRCKQERFERDARRDARLIAAGWAVLTVTWSMLEGDARQQTFAALRTALAARRHLRAPRPEIWEAFACGRFAQTPGTGLHEPD